MLMCAYAEVNIPGPPSRHVYAEIDLDQPEEPPESVALVTPRLSNSSRSRKQNGKIRMSIADVLRNLKDSGWYWGEISKEEAQVVLGNKEVGTFLLRDSTDVCHLFTLCVRTANGVQNIRVSFSRGRFKLDSVFPDLPAFASVVGLVEHYLDGEEFSITTDEDKEESVRLRMPLWIEVPSLQHLCRQALLRKLVYDPAKCRQLPIPQVLYDYLADYCPNY